MKQTDREIVNTGMEKLIAFKSGRNVSANLKDASFCIKSQNGNNVYLFGDIFYHIKNDGNIKLIDSDSEKYLKRFFRL